MRNRPGNGIFWFPLWTAIDKIDVQVALLRNFGPFTALFKRGCAARRSEQNVWTHNDATFMSCTVVCDLEHIVNRDRA